MPRARQVCAKPGCPNLQPCLDHDPLLDRRSSRNHRGVPRQARGHGQAYDELGRLFRGQPCELRFPGCTGSATGADLIVPRSRGGRTTRANARPACGHCQSVQGGRLSQATA
jgi:5-methylcytosine-specific restriction endonuclease McrA